MGRCEALRYEGGGVMVAGFDWGAGIGSSAPLPCGLSGNVRLGFRFVSVGIVMTWRWTSLRCF
jgi:hypothetical protein